MNCLCGALWEVALAGERDLLLCRTRHSVSKMLSRRGSVYCESIGSLAVCSMHAMRCKAAELPSRLRYSQYMPMIGYYSTIGPNKDAPVAHSFKVVRVWCYIQALSLFIIGLYQRFLIPGSPAKLGAGSGVSNKQSVTKKPSSSIRRKGRKEGE